MLLLFGSRACAHINIRAYSCAGAHTRTHATFSTLPKQKKKVSKKKSPARSLILPGCCTFFVHSLRSVEHFFDIYGRENQEGTSKASLYPSEPLSRLCRGAVSPSKQVFAHFAQSGSFIMYEPTIHSLPEPFSSHQTLRCPLDMLRIFLIPLQAASQT